MGLIMKKRLMIEIKHASAIISFGFLLAGGMKIGDHLIPSPEAKPLPEQKILVCVASIQREIETCAKLEDFANEKVTQDVSANL